MLEALELRHGISEVLFHDVLAEELLPSLIKRLPLGIKPDELVREEHLDDSGIALDEQIAELLDLMDLIVRLLAGQGIAGRGQAQKILGIGDVKARVIDVARGKLGIVRMASPDLREKNHAADLAVIAAPAERIEIHLITLPENLRIAALGAAEDDDHLSLKHVLNLGGPKVPQIDCMLSGFFDPTGKVRLVDELPSMLTLEGLDDYGHHDDHDADHAEACEERHTF